MNTCEHVTVVPEGLRERDLTSHVPENSRDRWQPAPGERGGLGAARTCKHDCPWRRGEEPIQEVIDSAAKRPGERDVRARSRRPEPQLDVAILWRQRPSDPSVAVG